VGAQAGPRSVTGADRRAIARPAGVLRAASVRPRDVPPTDAPAGGDPRAAGHSAGIVRPPVIGPSEGIVPRMVTGLSGEIVRRRATVRSAVVARVATIVAEQGLVPVRRDVVIVERAGRPARPRKTVTRSASSRSVRRKRSRTSRMTSSPVISTRSPVVSSRRSARRTRTGWPSTWSWLVV